MSWDVIIMRLPAEIRSYDDLGAAPGNLLLPLGAPQQVRQQVSEVFGGTDWTDPAWGTWRGEEGSIEFGLEGDREDEVESLMLHVRAEEAVAARILSLAERHGWRALDTTTCEFLAGQQPALGLSRWRAFRDRVLRRGES